MPSATLPWLHSPNPNQRPNSDVVRPWTNGTILTKERELRWVVDFPPETSLEEAALYAEPFGYLKTHVYPIRSKNRRAARADRWWIHGDPQKAMRAALRPLDRYICTPRVSKFRVFVWLGSEVLADSATVVFARRDDCFFGLLHSRLHEVWARALGTQLREVESGFRYTPRTCFETFPFPEPTPEQTAAIAAAAKELDELRNRWLNPPEWTRTEVLEFPGSTDGPWSRYIDPATVRPVAGGKGPHPDALPEGHRPSPPAPLPEGEGTTAGVGTVRWPRLVAKDPDCAESLKKRTLTSLYNQRPAWLDLAHRKLDEAVFAAYAWDPQIGDDGLLERLLRLNLERSGE